MNEEYEEKKIRAVISKLEKKYGKPFKLYN